MSKKIKTDIIQDTLSLKSKKTEIDVLTNIVNQEYLEVIKKSLKKRSITNEHVSKELGLSSNYVNQMMNGTKILTLRFITGIRRRFIINLELLEL